MSLYSLGHGRDQERMCVWCVCARAWQEREEKRSVSRAWKGGVRSSNKAVTAVRNKTTQQATKTTLITIVRGEKWSTGVVTGPITSERSKLHTTQHNYTTIMGVIEGKRPSGAVTGDDHGHEGASSSHHALVTGVTIQQGVLHPVFHGRKEKAGCDPRVFPLLAPF